MPDKEDELISTAPVLVSDFDGTMTKYDFYQLVATQLMPVGYPDVWQQFLTGELSHFSALQHIFADIRVSEEKLLTIAHAMELDKGLPTAVTRLQSAGWEVVVASAGCEWYITRLLQEQNIHIPIHANPGIFSPEHGLQMALPTTSPYYSSSTGIDKEAVVRAMLHTHACVAFAGDGRPDLPAAMLVPAGRRFARGWLATELSARGVPFQHFTNWSEIAAVLLKENSSC